MFSNPCFINLKCLFAIHNKYRSKYIPSCPDATKKCLVLYSSIYGVHKGFPIEISGNNNSLHLFIFPFARTHLVDVENQFCRFANNILLYIGNVFI